MPIQVLCNVYYFRIVAVEGVFDATAPIVIDAKSGVSGAGKSLKGRHYIGSE